MSRVVIFSTGVVRKNIIGPEIRVWEFARNLTLKGHTATLAVPNVDPPSAAPFPIVQYDSKNLRSVMGGHDVAIAQGDISAAVLRSGADIPLVFDLYDPYIVECLHMDPLAFPSVAESLRRQLRQGDFFLCASEDQRLFYLGMLTMEERIAPLYLEGDPTVGTLIDLVPFGAAEENLAFQKPAHTDPRRYIFLGGAYSWYDPFSALDALKKMVRQRADIAYLFVSFPFNIPAVKEREKAVMAYAAKIGVADHVVFRDWVAYEERSSLYGAADVALVIHAATLESRLSFRTRILDFLSFGLPVITSGGSYLESLMKDSDCGVVLGDNDPDRIAEWVLLLLDDEPRRNEQVKRGRDLIRERFLWQKVIEPLDAFCRAPSFSPTRHRDDSPQEAGSDQTKTVARCVRRAPPLSNFRRLLGKIR